ncbi:protein NRT1/ PTR FAMILY 5.10-like [Impatiens glandulifera]|uniref:protein NRT1/ PTR FAMILY 5.10-like n=1 Tax=Impatiens glandulifera TaxID=253017 RepID=UPI001FB18CA4|nr:protein NRT1/ PTR FAMILY 5.10-like [Impatiens glandulifera]
MIAPSLTTDVVDTTPLLAGDIVEGVSDYKGRPVVERSNFGGWKSASFIIGVEVAERFAYYGVSSNLISYLTGPLGQSTATAAANVNAWSGAACLLPLLGAFVADSFLGRYRTIIISSCLYTLAIGLLFMSVVLPFAGVLECGGGTFSDSCSPPLVQVILFFFALYLVAIAQGGHKPCVQAFGADQFDAQDPKECKAKSSFFNWWYFCMCGGSTVSILIMNYIQDNLSWGLGFGIPCIVIIFALVIFLLGTKTYRFGITSDDGIRRSSFSRISLVFIKAARNWRIKEEEAPGVALGSQQFRFINKALLQSHVNSNKVDNTCTIEEVEEAKAILRLVPIWGSCLIYAIVFAQVNTLFTKQGVTMDRSITPSFNIPPASLQSFTTLSIVIFMPVYDQIFVPKTRAITGMPSGITMLQRIGFGIFLSIVSMSISAIVERKRLITVFHCGLIDKPKETIPISVWWLVPQYILLGISDVFTIVGLQEFFYDQVPPELKSVGLAIYLSILGVGNLLSVLLIYLIETITNRDDRDSWFSTNLNRAHLDYFYWLLVGLSMFMFIVYLYFARRYIYNRGGKGTII